MKKQQQKNLRSSFPGDSQKTANIFFKVLEWHLVYLMLMMLNPRSAVIQSLGKKYFLQSYIIEVCVNNGFETNFKVESDLLSLHRSR